MTKAKTTKRALLASVLSMMLCMAMLVGSTFAWFTDSVTSGKNKIVAGNLDVELYVVNGEDETPVDENTNLFMKDALWEPGHVEVVNLKVANVGTLALQYKFGVNVAAEQGGTNVEGKDFKLSDYIMFGLVDGNNTYDSREAAIAAVEGKAVKLSALAVDENGVLLPADKATKEEPAFRYVTLVVYMPTTVGNEANYRGDAVPTIDLGVTLVATQATYENDSFGKDYDANATYDDEVVKYTFTSASDAIAFCPDCYNSKTTSGHADHKAYLIVKNGVAEVPQAGAWLVFSDFNWLENAYVLEYDIDLSVLADGAFVSFDCGEDKAWQDLHLGFKKTDGVITAYKALSSSNLTDQTKLGVVKSDVHVTYTFSASGNDLKMTMVIGDGTNTYSTEKTVKNFDTTTNLYWDVYTTEEDSDVYAALDNVVFVAPPKFQFSDAAANGGYIHLSEDASLTGKTKITSDTVVDLADNNLLLPGCTIEVNKGNLSISNGTISANHSFGYIDARPANGESVKVEFENVVFNGEAGASSNGNKTNKMISAYATSADSKIEYVFKNCTFNNASLSLNRVQCALDVTMEGCTFNNIAANGPTLGLTGCKGAVTIKDCKVNVTNLSGVCQVFRLNRIESGSISLTGCEFKITQKANAVCTIVDVTYAQDNEAIVLTDNTATLTVDSSYNAYKAFIDTNKTQKATVSNNVLKLVKLENNQ